MIALAFRVAVLSGYIPRLLRKQESTGRFSRHDRLHFFFSTFPLHPTTTHHVSHKNSNSSVVDTLIIGGGPAGVSTALTLARALHTVIVFDSGRYRNAKAAHMHAVTTWDHQRPDEFRGKAKSDILSRYDTMQFKDLVISSVETTTEGLFQLVDENGTLWRGRKLLLATGVTNIMPDIVGYSDCWVTGM
jgi:alkyl hydroperoxide reductase subunit AhpF